MIKHVILWKIKEDLPQKESHKLLAKQALEGLKGKIDGLLDITVNTSPLPTSNCDMMLDSSFESFEALKAYAIHPLHQAAAENFVLPITCERVCMDYEVE